MTVRVVVADDQDGIRCGLVMILNSSDDVQVVGEVQDGLSAVRTAVALRPDLVLMDIRMPGIDGIEATRRLVDGRVCDVLVLTTFDLDDYVDTALAAGAAGFLLKSAAAGELLEAVRAVANRLVDHSSRPVEPVRRPAPTGLDHNRPAAKDRG